MGRMTSLFARKVVAAADDRVDRAALLRSVGLTREGPPDPAYMLKAADYYDFFERVALADGHGLTLPLRAGASMRCNDYGALGLAMKSALTLGGTFERAARYVIVLTNVAQYEVERTSGGAFMHLHREGERRLGMRLSNEATLASFVAIAREVSAAPFQLKAVYLRHAAPSSTGEHEAYFGCPVHFDADHDALEMSTETLRAPNKLGDAGLVRFFDTHLDAEVAAIDDGAPLARQVHDFVTTSLSEGIPTLSAVARHLGMSVRTLQRRLADEGHSYQTLVDEARRRLARRLLKDTDSSLAEVAFMTGFSEQSAFTRAFKRWAGQTPRSFRLSAQGQV
ncbi:MAG: AraC family transcriptional regulator [Bacteroidota bacterium]